MSRRRTNRGKPPLLVETPVLQTPVVEMPVVETPVVPLLPTPSETAPNSARFDLPFCVLGGVLIVCAMLLTFRFAMSPDNARFMGCGDPWAYYGPTLSFMDHTVHEDRELPLWNPLYFCGQPHAANPQSFVFYPPNLLRSLLTFNPTPLRTHAGIALMVLAQTVVAGIGALLLARRHGYSYAAALLAAFAFPFSGALVTRAIGHWIFLNCACWLPWMLLGAHAMAHGRGFFKRAAAAAWTGLFYGLCILGGVPKLAAVGGLLLGAYWLLETLEETALAARGGGNGFEPRWKRVFRTLLTGGAFFGGAMAVAALLAAPLLLPLAEFARQTGRAAASARLEDDAPLGYGWQLFKTLVFYEGHGKYEGIRGGGAAVVSFALLALMLKPRWNGLRWGLLFFIILDLSVSEPLVFGYIVRAVVPSISNNPGRGMAVGCLPLAMLAGWGLDAIMQSSATRRRKMAISALVVAVGGAGLAILLLAAPLGAHAVPPVSMVFPALALVAALFGLWLREHLLTGILAAMFVLGEILAWNGTVLPDVMRGEILYQGSLRNLAMRKVFPLDNRRLVDNQPNKMLYDLQFIMNGYDPLHLLATRNTESPILIAPEKYMNRNIDAREPTVMSARGNLFLKRRFWLAREYCPRPLPGHGRLFPPARVVFLPDAHDLPVPAVAMDQVPETGLSAREHDASLLVDGQPRLVQGKKQRVPEAGAPSILAAVADLGEAATGSRHASLFLTFAGEGAIRLRPSFRDEYSGAQRYGFRRDTTLKVGEPQTLEFPLPDFDLMHVLLRVEFLGTNTEVLITAADTATDGDDKQDQIHIVRQTANQTDLRLTDLPGPRVLLFVDSFYPGWKATVDAKEVPILAANDAFKAIVVPAGSSEVRFAFSSTRVTVGLVLAGTAMALIGLAVSAQFLRRRRTAAGEP